MKKNQLHKTKGFTSSFTAAAASVIATAVALPASAAGDSGSLPSEGGSSLPSLSLSNPIIIKQNPAVNETLGSQTWSDADANGQNLSGQYLIGVGVEQDHAGTLLEAGETITITNSVADAGTIGIGTGASTIGSIAGTVNVTGQTTSVGIKLSGESYKPSSTGGHLESFTGTLNVTAVDGPATGIDIATGTMGSITGAEIIVMADEDGSNDAESSSAGISINSKDKDEHGNTIGTISDTTIKATSGGESSSVSGIFIAEGVVIKNDSDNYMIRNVDIQITAKNGQANFITASINPALTLSPDFLNSNKISGNFVMDMTGASENYAAISAGYVLGSSLSGTDVSLGFKNTYAVDGKPLENSTGFNIDWENTSMTIRRSTGFSAGSVVTNISAGMESTVLGSGSVINTEVTQHGSAVAAWINGVDLSSGKLLGTLNASVGSGVAVGLGTVGTDIAGSGSITQSANNTTLNIISGNITATVGQEVLKGSSVSAAGTAFDDTIAVGVQIGNVYGTSGNYKHYKTEFSETGAFSGIITATLGNTISKDGTLAAGTVVAGIVNYGRLDGDEYNNFNHFGYLAGDDTIKFDGNSTGGSDAAGTTVAAYVYKDNSLVGYGDAIKSIAGDTVLSTTSTNHTNTTKLIGNLTTGGSVFTGTSGQRQLVFEQGHFTVTSESWNAQEAVTFGGSSTTAEKMYNTVHVTLTDIATTVGDTTTINTETLNFYANSMNDSSLLKVAYGHELDFKGLTVVNIYLDGTEGDYTDTLYFVDAISAADFDADNTDITYNIYLDGSETAHEQHYNFRVVHDASGIYLFIPEPSTASMSLLALGGLLVRRRRRKAHA